MDKEENLPTVYGIILAGGTGRRMGADIPKQFLELGGKPVIRYSIEAFDASGADAFIIVVNDLYRKKCEEIIRETGTDKFAGFAPNGDERVWSVKNGLDLISSGKTSCHSGDNGKADRSGHDGSMDDKTFVLIHDGARPMITPELINKCIKTVKKKGACVPALELKDTVKRVDAGSFVKETPDRKEFRAVQTPQCFRLDIILNAYAGWEDKVKSGTGFIPTDDASLVEEYTDTEVLLIPGDEKNIKITTPADLDYARFCFESDRVFDK